jgi:ribosomal protein S18 acetylase RimI-like enzyme
MSPESISGPQPLGSLHEAADFECGVPSLDEYIAKQALRDQSAGKVRTFIIAQGVRVVGYFSVSAASIEPKDATARSAKGQGAQPIPAVLIGRFAVDSGYQGRRLGEAMLLEALSKSVQAADTIGARVVLVHAVDERARSFYLRYGFEASPTDRLHLMLLMKDVRKTLIDRA